MQQSPCHVHSHLLPGTLGKGNACTQPASDIRHSFVERFLLHRGRYGKPLLPVRVEHGEFHRDDVASVLNRGHQYVEPFALHLCRPRHKGILRHNDISRLHGFEQPQFHRLPVHQRLVLVYAGGYRVLSHSVPRAYRRVEAVVSWLAVSPDEVGIAHGLLQSRNGRFPDSLHRNSRSADTATVLPGCRYLGNLPPLSVLPVHVLCRQLVGLFQECHLVVSRRRGVLLLFQSVGQFRHLPFQFLFFLVHRGRFVERA